MIPAEWSLVDLCKSETATLVGVGDVSVVVVEVVESGIASLRSGGHVDARYTDRCCLASMSRVKEREEAPGEDKELGNAWRTKRRLRLEWASGASL